MNENKTIGDLLEKYPDGFSVGPAGMINKTLLATSYFALVARQYPVAPENGGYLVVEMTDEGNDGKYVGDSHNTISFIGDAPLITTRIKE